MRMNRERLEKYLKNKSPRLSNLAIILISDGYFINNSMNK